MKALRYVCKKVVQLQKNSLVVFVRHADYRRGSRRTAKNQGNKQPAGGNGTTITEPVVKYGPPPTLTPSPVRPPRMTVKYGPPSSFRPKLDDGQTPVKGLGEKTPQAQ